MANNARIFYPVQAVGLGTVGQITGQMTGLKGVQSVGSNVNFNLEQVFELGQLSIYENIEDIPDVEVTIEKVIDGRPLIQHTSSPGATATALSSRYDDTQTTVVAGFYPLTQENASGDPFTILEMSGMYLSAINFNLPVEGNATESVTFVGNNRTWTTVVLSTEIGDLFAVDTFRGSDSPVTASGGVARRENIVMGAGGSDTVEPVAGSGVSVWPTEIPGINVSGHNPSGSNGFDAHIQNVTVATNLGRTELFELGRRGPYFRYAEFPTEVTCSIEITASESGDYVDALADQNNLTDQTIRIRLEQGVLIDLGTSNKLSSINTAGGDAGGGNVTVTYNYSNFNDLIVTSTTDPAGL